MRGRDGKEGLTQPWPTNRGTVDCWEVSHTSLQDVCGWPLLFTFGHRGCTVGMELLGCSCNAIDVTAQQGGRPGQLSWRWICLRWLFGSSSSQGGSTSMASIPPVIVLDIALRPQVLFLLHFLFMGYVFLLFGSRNHSSSVPSLPQRRAAAV